MSEYESYKDLKKNWNETVDYVIKINGNCKKCVFDSICHHGANLCDIDIKFGDDE